MTEEQTVYQKALTKFGVDSQVNKLIEEMAELIVALSHYKIGRVSNVAEELADVDIVLEQIKPLFDIGDNSYTAWKTMKLNKLKMIV